MAKYSRTNLIVNYLPQDFSDDDFRRLFGGVGAVRRARVCRDKRTGYSFGFGFVEFYSPDDAGRAVRALNGLRLQRKTIKVAHARVQSAESKNCNLHLANLPPGVTAADIRGVLSSFGGIINCKILADARGASRGVGFCLFETRSAASQALAALHGKPWPGSGEAQQAQEDAAAAAADPSAATNTASQSNSLVQVRFADENEKKVRPPAATTAAAPAAAASPTQQQPQQQPQQPQQPLQLQQQQQHNLLPHHAPPPPPPQMPPPYAAAFYPNAPLPPPMLAPPPHATYASTSGYAASFHHQPASFYPLESYAASNAANNQQSTTPPHSHHQQPLSAATPPPPPAPTTLLRVCNLPPGWDERQLCAMFAPFGCLAGVQLEPPVGHQPAPAEGDLLSPGGAALIAFAAYHSAAAAAMHWNGQMVCGRYLQTCLVACHPQQQQQQQHQPHQQQVPVNGLGS